jgi:uncharacterized membrane protein
MAQALGTAVRDVAPPIHRVRLDSIDLVRSIVMILMLLDHTRDFAHEGGLLRDPLDPATTTPILYLTRWITHLCAPTFVMLAGLSVGLKRLRGDPVSDVAHLLWTRGLWLVFLEFTLIRVIVWFNLDFSFLAQLQVIWAIGLSMIVLAALVRLPVAVLAALGAVIVLGHNALDAIQVPRWFPGAPDVPGVTAKLWILVHQGGFFPIGGAGTPVVWGHYPVLAWTGIMLLGYSLSEVYAWTAGQRRRAFVIGALAMIALFAVLRATNVYGDPRPWVAQDTTLKTAMSFMDVTKYPPSLLFTLVTLAPALLLLGALDGRALAKGPLAPAVTFGRVPFFFYVLQWIWAHLAGITISVILGKSIAPYFMHVIQLFTMTPPPDIGGPLWTTYLFWLAGLFVLYWPCRWFAAVKARRRERFLSYL